jgi:hypothetical protein
MLKRKHVIERDDERNRRAPGPQRRRKVQEIRRPHRTSQPAPEVPRLTIDAPEDPIPCVTRVGELEQLDIAPSDEGFAKPANRACRPSPIELEHGHLEGDPHRLTTAD